VELQTTPLTKPLLKEDLRRRRILWAKQMKDQDWEKVIFTDVNQPSSCIQTLARNGLTTDWGFNLDQSSTHPKFMFMVVSPALDSESSFALLRTSMPPDSSPSTRRASCLLPKPSLDQGIKIGFFKRTTTPNTRGKMAAKWRRENGINRMVWPAQSPDLNPIENVWAVMKLNVRKEKPTTVKALVRAIRREWEGLSEEYAQALISSMSRRVKGVIEANGDHLMY
jgi:hypothetical protein